MLAVPVALCTAHAQAGAGRRELEVVEIERSLSSCSFRCTSVCSDYGGVSSDLSSFAVHCCAMKRRYELKRRAERLGETRNRIVAATVDLHTTVGPAHTTISAIADRAGAAAHRLLAFPERGICSLLCHWAAHPFPDASAWTRIGDPEQLRAALGAVYEWYESVGHDLDVFRRDTPPRVDSEAGREARGPPSRASRHAR